ncbi:sulfurtransferase TusA family protein [Microbacterium gorillae]|uniref:sulfurtransferase TusA family protein n=1 Tax=Microbacterium gorillae TaxID=1231063 RepID=UPI00058FA36A|nr:sulfurtransferase TusA family protein [Microbacterium gorillae]
MTVHLLETAGQVCPFPLVEAQAAIAELPAGDELRIDFDCTQATDSLPRWAAEEGYPVTAFEQVGDASWTITVQKPA